MTHRRRTCLLSTLAATLLAVPVTADETKRRCADYDQLKQPFFGSTHVHTTRSFDASINLVPATPREAYRYAKGEITMPGVDSHGRVTRQYPAPDPPLDWGTVTDHSEYFGAVGICQNHEEKPPGYFSLDCQLIRGFYYQPKTGDQHGAGLPPSAQKELAGNVFRLMGTLVLGPGSRNIPLPICNDFDCANAELDVWAEMIAAADEANRDCNFTAFIGYEATSAPGGTTWHRNVIFKNSNVVRRPVTAIDMALIKNPDPEVYPPLFPGPQDPEKLWDALDEKCLQMKDVIRPDGEPCNVLTIPHNSNLGGGVYVDGKPIVPPAFFSPPTRGFAEKRQFWEPLVEIYQSKGSSECRWDPRTQTGVETADEHCAFELLDAAAGAGAGGGSSTFFPERSWVRNVLKDGLTFLQKPRIGVNPFKLGIVASNDTHNGTMGWHPEDATFRGHVGIQDAVPTRDDNIQDSSGGHSVVWAEENSRESIFAALRRKETYGTSGTRPIVRFFGGWDFKDLNCQGNFVEEGYEKGVPMGGDLPPRPTELAHPTFVVAAWKDEYIKTPLERIQVIKGWVDKDGKTHEKVVTIAGGDRDPGVDTDCQRKLRGRGYDSLCKVWVDKEFHHDVPAFYYARVLEDPVCRYSTLLCQEEYGINPLDIDCANQLAALEESDPGKASDAAMCCQNETTTPIVQPVIQERAWTSPIWYTPPSDLTASEE